jgi:hypothetical protein
MKISELVEAPIEDINVYGDQQQPGSFRQEDLGIIASPKGQDKIKRVLFKIPVPVVLHFINDPTPIRGIEDVKQHLQANTPSFVASKPQRSGLMDPARLQRTYGVQVQQNPDAFNLVIIENEGVERYPLSPWIIAHRMYHAFQYIGENWHDVLREEGRVGYHFLTWLQEEQGNVSSPQGATKELLQAILPTKAGREGQLVTSAEFFPEIFALWCVTGKITLNPSTVGPYFDMQLQQWMTKFESAFYTLLQWGVGKYIAL